MDDLSFQLADAFIYFLRLRLTEEIINEIVERNRTPAYKGEACASHDFCDANMVMQDAFIKVTGRKPDMQSDKDTYMWNRAWNIASTIEFKVN